MKILKKIVAAFILLQLTSFAQATIIYEVNRVIGNGTVTGFIETDGTLGLIDHPQIINWSLDMTSPDINGGVTSNGSTGDATFGGGIIATATDLLFDYDAGGIFGFWAAGDAAWWCQAGTGNGGCFDSPGELMGYSDLSGGAAEHVVLNGIQSFASVASVPEPGSLALIGIGLIGIGWTIRRKV